jgi:hypothetical protein
MIRGGQCPRGGTRAFHLAGVVLLVLLAGSLVLPQAAGAVEVWRVTGPLVPGRYGHTATLLNSGKVLVAGGYNGRALTSSKLYDPASGSWSATTNSLSVGRWQHTATLLPDGKVLVAGGNNGGSLASAELYDPYTGTWSTIASHLSDARENHTATLLPNGKVLVAGGITIGQSSTTVLSSSELYDPSTGTWSPTGPLTNGRSEYTATLLNTGKVLVAGGRGAVNALKSAELFDPSANAGVGAWSPTGSLTTGRAEHTATLLPNGKVLVAGGFEDSTGAGVFLKSAELFDPSDNAGVGAWSPTGSLTTERAEHTATLLPNGKVLVAGGLNRVSGAPNWLTSVNLYDPAKAIWSATSSLTVGRDTHTATLLPGGRVLVVGGLNNNGTLTSAEIYNRPDISGVLYLLLDN